MKLLETEWMNYRNAVIPKDAGSTQLQESRRAFYAGAWAYYALVMNHPESGAEETPNDLALMQKLDAEMREFQRASSEGLRMNLEPEAERQLMRRFEREVLPELKASAASVTIYSGAFDAKLALEFGAAVLLEKPIMLLVVNGARIPSKMLAVVDEIVEIDGDINAPLNREKISAGVARAMKLRRPR